ncbi:MAG: hypothetical protein AMXMBFR81_23210 [Chthonomonas sp.]
MNQTGIPSRTRTGGALISALTFASVTTLVIAGVGSLMLSHSNRARVEAAHSKAIHLAEAGINYEIDWASLDPNNEDQPHHVVPSHGQSGIKAVAVGKGKFEVGIVSEDGSPWKAGSPMKVISTGTYGGVSRTIEAVGRPQSVFGGMYSHHNFGAFGLTNVRLNGAPNRIEGNLGTNGSVTFHPSWSSMVTGDIVFFGSNPTISGPNVYRESESKSFPTVSELVAQRFEGGWSYLKTNNDNANLKKFNPNLLNYLLTNVVGAGFTKATWTLTNNSFNTLVPDLHAGDKPKKSGGYRYNTDSDGLYGKKVLIMPPGNYYFESVSVTSGSAAILVDNSKGPVNIWIGGSGTSGDSLNCTMILTDPDPRTFRIYYGKKADLSVNGTTWLPGAIYAVDDSKTSSVTMSGNTTIYGSVVAWYVRLNGTNTIEHPGPGSSIGYYGDPVVGYSYGGQWREVNAQGDSVFPDGTKY